MASMVMGSPARSSSAQLLLLFLVAYFLFCSSLDAPPHSIAAAAEDPQPPLSFSFDFSNTSSYRSEDLKFEGDAAVDGKKVDLTCNSHDQIINSCTGRMSYGHPVPFYDNTTGEVASFSSRFTFAIILNGDANNKGDGVAFFLASYPSSTPPAPGSAGGNLGLIGGGGRTAYDAARFVAVEFDTFPNDWDPKSSYDHIGIDISSVASVNTTSLANFSLSGTMTASITFDNSTRMLVASLQFDDHPSLLPVQVSTKLPHPDTLLPPEVAVGFSAATGASIELHQILSWSFNSTLPAPSFKSTLPAPSFDSTLPAPSFGSTPPAPSPFGSTPPAPSPFGSTPPAPSPFGSTPPAPSPFGSTPPAPSPFGSTPPAPSPFGSTPPAPSFGSTPPAPSPFGSTPPAPSFGSTAPAPSYTGHDKKAAIIGGSLLLVLVPVVWCILSCWKWKSRRRALEKAMGGPRQFEYHDLAAATGHFSDLNKLGKGAFAVVYRGSLKELDREVAVKKILKDSRGGNKDFFAELNAISQAKHKNLVKLVGWCRGNSWNISDFMCWCRQNNNYKLFLVYELVPNGNLHDHLHEREEVLPWPTRYKIVKDIASALLYLHWQCDPYILHRDIKPSNILLDEHFNAKLADFGLSRIANHDNATMLTVAVGTEGYLDPQCRKSGMVEFNRSTDVYSFGLVLLEIACARKSREHVCDLYRSKSTNRAADQKLNDQFDVSEMDRVIVLGLRCSLPESTRRPTIRQAIDFLEHGVPLPELSEMDVSVSSEHEVYSATGTSSGLKPPTSAGSNTSNELPA